MIQPKDIFSNGITEELNEYKLRLFNVFWNRYCWLL